jgi:hypothetical protein
VFHGVPTAHTIDSGFLLIDANNAFNEINRINMLWTIRHEWPAGARFAFNCYSFHSLLIIRNPGGIPTFMFSKEGVSLPMWIAVRRQQLLVSRCPYSARHSLRIPGQSNRSFTLHVPIRSIHPAPQCNPDSARHQRRTKQTPKHSLLGTWDRGPQSLGTTRVYHHRHYHRR